MIYDQMFQKYIYIRHIFITTEIVETKNVEI